MERILFAACWLLACAPWSIASQGGELTDLETEHYLLRSWGSELDREELGRVLEAAYARFGKVSGRSPTRTPRRLEVVVFEDSQAWNEGLALRGAVPPPDVRDLWFRAEDEVVYACGPLSTWQTRAFLFQGAWQQFHFACMKKHEDLAYHWYVTGIGLHLSMHRWDGKRLELGVLPRIASCDLPELATQDFGAGVLGSSRFTDESLHAPGNAWAYVTYLLTGPKPEYRARFEKFALGLKGSMLSGDDFARTLGDPDVLARDLERWLETIQIPLRPICGDWDDLDGEVLRGRGAGGQAIAVLKEPAREFEVRVAPGSSLRAGVLLHWNDENDYEVAWIESSIVHVLRWDGVEIERLARRPIRGGKESTFVLSAEGDATVLVVDGERVHAMARSASRFGMCVEDGEARFRALSWR